MKPHLPAPGDVHPSDDDLLDLAHELPAADIARRWLDHVRQCGPCEARFRAAAEDRDFWLAHPRGRTVAPAPPPAAVVRPDFRRWATPVAAAAALALAVLAPSLRHPGSGRSDARWLPVTHERTLLRTPELENAGLALDRALGTYRSGDAAAALHELEALELPPEAAFESALRRLYLASAQVLNAQPDAALRTLGALDVATLPEPWKRWARWTQYLAARDAHHESEAQALLTDLARANNDVGDRARAEQKRLTAP